MAVALQLQILEPNDDFSLLCREDTRLEKKIEDYRKSYHAANDYLSKMINVQQQEIMILKKCLTEKLGITLEDLTPLMPEPKKRGQKAKSKIEHPTFPGI